jgi:hypothetical protein
MDEVDKNKLKELKNIISLVSINKEKYISILKTFENENPSQIYFPEIIFESEPMSDKEKEIILEKMEFNFHDNEETFIRKLIKNSDNPNVQTFLPHYLQHNSQKTFLFPIMIDEISKLTNEISSYIERVLNYVHLMSFEFKDSNILKFHSDTLKLISERLNEDGNKFLLSIFIEGNPNEEKERFNLLYPDLKLILLESELDEDLMILLPKILKYIPSEDIGKLLEKLLIIFADPDSRFWVHSCLSNIFVDFNKDLEDYSQQYCYLIEN